MKNTTARVKIGDEVRLTREFCERVGWHTYMHTHYQTTIIWVGNTSLTAPVTTFPVRTTDDELNNLLLDDPDFEVITPS
jgi:hypothetical protein